MQLSKWRQMWIALGLLVGIGLGAPAHAVLFTLDQSIHFSGGSNGGEGILLPVSDESGTLGTTAGTVNLLTQDFFIFQVVLCDTGDPFPCSGSASGDVDFVTVTVGNDTFPANNPRGTGHIDPGGGEQAPDFVTNNMGSQRGEYEFDLGNNTAANLEAGETSDKLFVTFDAGDLSVGSSVSFMVQSGTTFDVTGGTIVPEPTTALLLGAGLLGLALVGRRR